MNTLLANIVQHLRLAVAGRLARLVLVLAVSGVYALVYLPLRDWVGVAAGLLASVPVIVCGSLFGLRGGLVAGLATPLLNTLLLNWAGSPGWDASWRETGGLGPLTVIGVGAVVGRLSDLSRALRASEERYRQIFETNQAIKLVTDPTDGRIVQANAAATWFYGYDLATLTAMRLQDLNILSEAETRAEMARAAAAQRLAFNARHRLASGAVRDVEVYSGPVQVGHRSLLYSIIHDVTERKQAEAALQHEQRYKLLMQTAADAIHVLDQAGNLREWNPAFLAHLGYTHEEAAALNVADWEVRWASDEVGAKIPELLQTPARFETRHRRKDGTVRAVEINAAGVRLEGETLLYAAARDITERLAIEAALRESEARNRAYLNAIPDLMFILDADGRFLDYNTPDPAQLAAPPEQFLGHAVADVLAAEQAAHITAAVKQTLATGQTHELEYALALADGDHWYEARLAPLDERRVLAIVHEVTERRRLQAELQAERDFALSVMNTMGQGLTVTDAGGRFDYINPAYAKLAGCQPSDLLGKTPLDMAADPDQAVLAQAAADRQAGRTTTYESRLRRADGRLVDVLITGTPRWRDGRVQGSVAVITDLTERKQAERAMADERVRLRALIAASRDGIVLIGMDRQVHVVNEPALRYLDMPGQPGEWEGRPLGQAMKILLTRQAPAELFAEVRRVRSGAADPADGEWRLSARALHWMSQPVYAGAQMLGWLLVLRDVTAERQVEQLREDLTRTMVHDLRNPLHSLRSALQFFALDGEGPLSESRQAMLNLALQGADAMLDLVAAILDVSRLESGQMPLQRTPTSLAEMVAALERQQAPLAAQRRLTLTTELAPDLPAADVDPDLLRRVFQNLVGNALKFTSTGGAVHVTAARPAGERQIWVTVSDTGPGIAPEVLGRLFQKFVTGHVPGHGSGLGLVFCRQVVEAHGGRIWVESGSGQGTTFTFTVPAWEWPAGAR